MKHYVILDRRSYGSRAKAWIPVTCYDPLNTTPIMEVPEHIKSHWKANKSPGFGYASIRGLNATNLHILTGLANGRRLRVGINRWGDISSYKLTN